MLEMTAPSIQMSYLSELCHQFQILVPRTVNLVPRTVKVNLVVPRTVKFIVVPRSVKIIFLVPQTVELVPRTVKWYPGRLIF